MGEALLIFRKDVRRLWWEISVLVALMMAVAVLDASSEWRARMGGMLGLLEFVVVFGSWYVVALAVQEEKLAGERQYWLTRPMRRSSLLFAKLLFVASFVVLPTLLAQTLALLPRGLSPWAYRSDLLAFHIPLAASLMVIVVVASVVANISGFVSALLLGIAIMVAGVFGMEGVDRWLSLRADSGMYPIDASGESYPVVCLVGLAAAAILVFHYARRRTAIARTWLAALAVFQGAALAGARATSGVLYRLTPALERPLPGGRPTLSFDPTREPPLSKAGSISQVRIPIRIEGLPPGTLAAGETIDYKIQSPGEPDYGPTMRVLGADWVSGRWFDAVSNGDAWLRLHVERSYARPGTRQQFHARLRLVLLEVRTVETPLSHQPTRVMRDAWCSASGAPAHQMLVCYWPFQRPDYIQVLNPPPLRQGEIGYVTARSSTIYIAPGAPWGQSVWQETATRIPPGPATVEARKVIARFERTLDIPNISIWKYTALIEPPKDRFLEGLSQQP